MTGDLIDLYLLCLVIAPLIVRLRSGTQKALKFILFEGVFVLGLAWLSLIILFSAGLIFESTHTHSWFYDGIVRAFGLFNFLAVMVLLTFYAQIKAFLAGAVLTLLMSVGVAVWESCPIRRAK
jgi:hypothetical protein